MKQQVLFVQGGGEGAYAEDQALADYLGDALREVADVHYPKFPGLESVDYHLWRSKAVDALKDTGDEAIIVAHSLGGAALLKMLSEDKPAHNIRALFLVAMPYKCADGEWGGDDFALANDFAQHLPAIQHLTLYHSQDDEWVPFNHLHQYAQKWPEATTVPLAGRGHSFMKVEFTELVEAIQSCIDGPSSQTAPAPH